MFKDKEVAPTAQQVIDNRFSLVELRRIHAQLVENKRVTDENQNLVVEILRVLAEMVVYGDRKSELLFDYFCEKNMLQLFLEIMWSEGGCPAAVHVQILQTLSILISSVKNDTSLYYLLSNNHINEVMVFPHNMTEDESLCAQYVSFIKTLSLRLNDQTVQFFFIEETGAFPILTRSVEMLKEKEPMVRIAAQSAILNVYKVNEPRARQFALQQEVMLQLFQAVIQIMSDQVDQLCTICRAYSTKSREGDDAACVKLEQSLSDCFVALEDWLYYIQDLLSLDIEIFSTALVNYMVDSFVGPVLLSSLLHMHTTDDGFLPLKRSSSTEIDAERPQDRPSVLLAAVSRPVEQPEQLNSCVCLAYLLQMLRIVGSSAFTESVLIALLHPLNANSREVLTTSGEADFGAHSLQANPYRNAFAALYHSDSQRLVLLGNYVLYALCGLFREQRKRELSDKMGLVETSQEIANRELMFWLEVLHVVPHGTSAVEDMLMTGKLAAMGEVDRTVVKPYFQRLGARRSDDLFCTQMVKMLQLGQTFSLAAVQAVAFSLSLMLTVMVSPTTVPAGAVKPIAIVEGIEPTDDFHVEAAKITVLREVREACRSAAQSLLSRLSTSFSEVMLVLINEETKRFSGRQWRLAFQRMSANKSLFLPPTPAHLAAMGIDFDMPISQTEAIRKEVQIFLLLRALFKLHVQRKKADSEDLSSCVQDKDLLCLEDVNMIPSNISIGTVFDMKGKKFLDAILSVAPVVAQDNSASSSSLSSSFAASATSIFGWASSGSSSRRSSASSATMSPQKSQSPVGNASGSPMRTPGNGSTAPPTKVKLLFVQDPQLLLLTCQDKAAGKSVFRIHVLAPLLYTDAKVDLLDRRKLKLLVRSWKPMTNMTKVETEFSDNGDLELSNAISSHSSSLTNALYGDSSAKRIASMEGYLQTCQKSQLYQIALMMDTEQACSLAAQHIESRRKSITVQKVDKLRSVLSNWALDSFDVLSEVESVSPV